MLGTGNDAMVSAYMAEVAPEHGGVESVARRIESALAALQGSADPAATQRGSLHHPIGNGCAALGQRKTPRPPIRRLSLNPRSLVRRT